jgi:hypothetical protein
VIVGQPGQRCEDGGGKAESERHVPRLRRQGAAEMSDVVRDHTRRPGTDRQVTDGRMQRMAQDGGAVHEVLERTPRATERPVHGAHSPLEHVGHLLQPPLPPNDSINQALGHLSSPSCVENRRACPGPSPS